MADGEFHLRAEQLVNFVATLSSSQHLLIQSALGFQSLAMAKKHHIKMAIDQADDVGVILGRAIDALEAVTSKVSIVSEPKETDDDPNRPFE